MITKQEESVGYLVALEQKEGQGNFGHTGRPGHIGGSGGGSGKVGASVPGSIGKDEIEKASSIRFPRKLGSTIFSESIIFNAELKTAIGKIDRHLKKNGWQSRKTEFYAAPAKAYKKGDDEITVVGLRDSNARDYYIAVKFGKVGDA